MKLLAVLVFLQSLSLLQAEELRLNRKAPDLVLRMQAEYRADGQVPLSLVLSGGAAKGLVHFGVFEILEEEGISEDGLAGTSSGAMMGALRAAGFSGRGLRWAFKNRDFGNAILDSRRRTHGMTLSEDEDRAATVIRFDLLPEGWEFLPGEATGQAATQLLMTHLLRANALCGEDFSRLRVPFADRKSVV